MFKKNHEHTVEARNQARINNDYFVFFSNLRNFLLIERYDSVENDPKNAVDLTVQ